jgi:superoxide dismutase, Fe-Mn family
MKNLDYYIRLVESADVKIKQQPLPVSRDSLEPAMSKETVDLHYGKLARAYVDRYNKGEGDRDFNYGGASLHNIFFEQLTEYRANNRPGKELLEFFKEKFGSFEQFKDEFFKTAMAIQGSGWAYLAPTGDIKTIKNHDYRSNMKILLLVDWWEHAFVIDYGSDKERYLNNFWKIVNWDTINQRRS